MIDNKDYRPKHLQVDTDHQERLCDDQTQRHGQHTATDLMGLPTENTDDGRHDTAHPWGIPMADGGGEAEFIPLPGRGGMEHLAPNGAVIRNPWSQQPEVKPDHAYTEEQEDLNLIQL